MLEGVSNSWSAREFVLQCSRGFFDGAAVGIRMRVSASIPSPVCVCVCACERDSWTEATGEAAYLSPPIGPLGGNEGEGGDVCEQAAGHDEPHPLEERAAFCTRVPRRVCTPVRVCGQECVATRPASFLSQLPVAPVAPLRARYAESRLDRCVGFSLDFMQQAVDHEW